MFFNSQFSNSFRNTTISGIFGAWELNIFEQPYHRSGISNSQKGDFKSFKTKVSYNPDIHRRGDPYRYSQVRRLAKTKGMWHHPSVTPFHRVQSLVLAYPSLHTRYYINKVWQRFLSQKKKAQVLKTYAFKGGGSGSNRRHSEPQSDALTNWTTSTIWLYLPLISQLRVQR